jgi:site-specific recombinase
MTANPAHIWTPRALEAELASLLSVPGATAPIDTLRLLMDRIRPGRATPGDAELRLRAMLAVLRARPDLRHALIETLERLCADRHAVLLLATSGIYPNTGFLAETARRLSHKLLPEAEEPSQLKSALGVIARPGDAHWLASISFEAWLGLVRLVRPAAAGPNTPNSGWHKLNGDVREAIRVVAHRIAAGGLEAEFLRLEPTLEQHASPFMALCDEVLDFVKLLDSDPAQQQTAEQTHRHILILIDQSRAAIDRVRRSAQREGASFMLTFRMRRLHQHLDRLQSLLHLECIWDGETALQQRSAALVRELLLAECSRNDLHDFWRQNSELVALRVAENAGRSGEHYITSTREQYMSMLRAAAGGGFVVACMATLKLLTASANLAPLTEILANCLNYGIGFVLIHLLHFAVATKQPAMTANAIAAALDAPPAGVSPGLQDARRRFSALVELVARTVRTQLAAVCGNIAVALPTAVAIAGTVWWFTGRHFVSQEKAVGLLESLQPFTSAALAYAAVAGVCLFLAGLIAGFYDNLCAYNRIPQRLMQLHWPKRLLGQARMQRLADYVGNNLGALAGNFSLGFLLGGASGLGALLAWPLDVRHVTLTSANWGFAMTSLNLQADWQQAALAALGVGLIGAVNLLVSFSLALWIALRSRGIASGQARRVAGDILRAFRQHPRAFLLPPRKLAAAETQDKLSSGG